MMIFLAYAQCFLTLGPINIPSACNAFSRLSLWESMPSTKPYLYDFPAKVTHASVLLWMSKHLSQNITSLLSPFIALYSLGLSSSLDFRCSESKATPASSLYIRHLGELAKECIWRVTCCSGESMGLQLEDLGFEPTFVFYCVVSGKS